ncbi:MAG: DUF6788 family protein [Pseudomonadota bacterium]
MRLKDQPGKLLPVFLEGYPLVRGTVYPLRRRCGKPNCRCARGKLHETTVLSASISGRSRLWTVPSDQVEKMSKLTKRYQRFRTARADFVKLYTKMLRAIDAIEKVRRKDT